VVILPASGRISTNTPFGTIFVCHLLEEGREKENMKLCTFEGCDYHSPLRIQGNLGCCGHMFYPKQPVPSNAQAPIKDCPISSNEFLSLKHITPLSDLFSFFSNRFGINPSDLHK